MTLLLERPRARQPQVGAPLSDLARRSDLFFEQGGLRSSVGVGALTLTSTPEISGAPYGIGRLFSGAAQYLISSGWPVLTDGTEYTYLVVFGRVSSSGSIEFLINGDNTNRAFQFRLTAGGAPEFIAFNTAVSTFSTSGQTVPIGVSHCAIAVVSASGVRLYQNGILTGTSSAITGTIKGQAAGDPQVGNRLGSYLRGTIGQIVRWPYALPDAVARQVSAGPWGLLFAPRRIWVPQSAATGPSTQNLTPDLLTNTSSFYAPTVTPGAVTVSPDRLDNAQTLYAPTVSATYSITPDRLDNAQTFYAPTISVGAVTLTPGRVDNVNEFFAPTVSQGGQIIAPDLLSNTQSFYAPTVTPGAVTLTLGLLTNTQTFYAPRVFDPAAVSTSLSGVYFDVLSGRLLVLRSGT